QARSMDAPLLRYGTARNTVANRRLHVVDLSGMWAGPLCGAILAELGGDVMKVESTSRPDAARIATPALFERLNRCKSGMCLDFADTEARAWIRDVVGAAD